jgi:serine/threonine-protein kinase
MQLDLLLAHLSPLLDQAAELTPDARVAWLAQLRRQRPDVAAELAALLDAEPGLEESGFLSSGVAEQMLSAVPAGGQAGPYALVRPLGDGGMGSVWLGQRNDGRYEGQVAVKLLSGALLHPAGVARFRREADALARLTHPGIARLIDAGVSPAGQSYLVLEFVDGVPIDDYCDAHRLTPWQRLELLQQVLGAVAHAHASLVVHRDIKPSNILVTRDGRAKLLDFGIATLLESDVREADGGGTEGGGITCTPRFAAPEQLTGGPISAASDVYALGVLLYILLAGAHPAGRGGGETHGDLDRIAEADPPPLSAAIASPAAACRAMPLDQLRRLYAGDLDAIAARALQKAPGQRHPTAAALNADLDRFLRHEPVQARPATLAYRLRKLVRRNRVAVSAAIGAAGLLLATTGYALYQLNQAERQRDAARVQRDRAVFERRRAAASDNFMQALLSTIGSSEPIRPGDLLQRGRALLDQASTDDPRVVAPLMMRLASQFHFVAGLDGVRAERELLSRAVQFASAGGDRELEAMAECRLALFAGRTENDTAAVAAHAQRASRLLAGSPRSEPDVTRSCLLAEAYRTALEGGRGSAIGLLQRFDSLLAADPDSMSMTAVQYRFDAADVWLRLRLYRVSLAQVRRADALLVKLGHSSSMLHLSAINTQYYMLNRFGEFRAADSMNRAWLELARRRGEDLAGFIEVHAASHAAWEGRPDSVVRTWDRRVARARRAGTLSEGTLVPLIRALTVAKHFGEARSRLAEYAKRSDASAVQLRALRGRLAEAEGRVKEARSQYDEALRLLCAPCNPERLDGFWYLFLRNGEMALIGGDVVAADSLAQQALYFAHRAEQDELRSGQIGQIRLLQARIALARRDSSSAADLARRAIRSLQEGFGKDRPETLAATTLLAGLTRPPPARAAAAPPDRITRAPPAAGRRAAP